MKKTNKDWVEKTIKEMWKARVVNYDPYLEKDQVYKEGWEQGFRFALYKKDQQHKQELEALEKRFLPVINLDDNSRNCEICGYDHEYKTPKNNIWYLIEHELEAQRKAFDEVFIELVGMVNGLSIGTWNDKRITMFNNKASDLRSKLNEPINK